MQLAEVREGDDAAIAGANGGFACCADRKWVCYPIHGGRLFLFNKKLIFIGEPVGIRTRDLLIKSQGGISKNFCNYSILQDSIVKNLNNKSTEK